MAKKISKYEINKLKAPNRKKLSDNQILRIKDMFARGYSKTEIAKATGTSLTTVYYHLNDKYRKNKIKAATDRNRQLTKENPELLKSYRDKTFNRKMEMIKGVK